MAGRSKGGPKTGGRQKGTPNKTTALLKDAILQAAELAGGPNGLTGYLHMQAGLNPGPFMTLLGKVLPTQLTGDPAEPIHMKTESDAGFAALVSALDIAGQTAEGGDRSEGEVVEAIPPSTKDAKG